MVKRVKQGITVNKETLAVEVIMSVGAGGNYLTEEHTVRHMRKEHSRASLIERRAKKSWEEAGGTDMITRARGEVYGILENHKPETLDPGVMEKLKQVVREAEEEVDSR